MRPPIDDAVALVTGASSGIGRELARLLAPRVRALVLVARRTDRLHALAAELTGARPDLVVDVRPCDLCDPEAVDALAQAVEAAHGGIDLLINNAGMGDIGLFEAREPAKIQRMLQVNVLGLTSLTRALLPGMVQRGRGGVLNVSSGFGLTWMPGFAAYVGSKHYVTAFSDSLRCELAGTGVVVSQLCPGPVATEFEQVAENPTDQQVPAFMQISPERCARDGLRAFERGRALIIPGAASWLAINAGRLTPRWLLRLVYGQVGRAARRQMPTALSSTGEPAP